MVLLTITLGTTQGQVATVDPGLVTAIGGAALAENTALNEVNKTQGKIAAAQAVIGANIKIMKDYEEKVYQYLSNVSDAVSQSFEIKEAAELTVEIANSFKTCAQAATKHPQGTLYTAIVARRTSTLTAEMLALYSYINSIALNKNTLLNSAERQMIINQVLYKLRNIKFQIYMLEFRIKNNTLADLPRFLAPKGYYYFTDGKRIADKIIRSYSKK
jgi:ABC-type methionine transport system permease subunit